MAQIVKNTYTAQSLPLELIDYYVCKELTNYCYISNQKDGGSCLTRVTNKGVRKYVKFNPSTSWLHGGPLIDYDSIFVIPFENAMRSDHLYSAETMSKVGHNITARAYGKTYLEAAMRSFLYGRCGWWMPNHINMYIQPEFLMQLKIIKPNDETKLLTNSI